MIHLGIGIGIFYMASSNYSSNIRLTKRVLALVNN